MIDNTLKRAREALHILQTLPHISSETVMAIGSARALIRHLELLKREQSRYIDGRTKHKVFGCPRCGYVGDTIHKDIFSHEYYCTDHGEYYVPTTFIAGTGTNLMITDDPLNRGS